MTVDARMFCFKSAATIGQLLEVLAMAKKAYQEFL
jgi:hypothetical protein